jgi:Fe-Mn family superoxide dismutase
MKDKISIDVKSLVRDTIKKTLTDVEPIHHLQLKNKSTLIESYIAEPKKFKQLSDSVSQKTKDAHYDLYTGYIESLNKVSAELDSADRNDVNPRHSRYRSLKVDETYNLNAAYLHELYFANCFDPNSEIYMDSMPYIRLQRDFGTFEDWQHDFMACALSANEGWAVCGYNVFLKKFINTFVDSHNGNVMLGFIPLVVVDMWSHSFYKDYLSDKKSYLLAQMKELNWKVIEERFLKIEKLVESMR